MVRAATVLRVMPKGMLRLRVFNRGIITIPKLSYKPTRPIKVGDIVTVYENQYKEN